MKKKLRFGLRFSVATRVAEENEMPKPSIYINSYPKHNKRQYLM